MKKDFKDDLVFLVITIALYAGGQIIRVALGVGFLPMMNLLPF